MYDKATNICRKYYYIYYDDVVPLQLIVYGPYRYTIIILIRLFYYNSDNMIKKMLTIFISISLKRKNQIRLSSILV